MLRLSPLRTLAALVLVTEFCVAGLRAADPIDAACSVERLRMLLQSIDPYLPKEQVSGVIKVFGSSTMDGLAHAWADNFREFHPDIRVEVVATGVEAGAERMKSESGGLWLVSRPLKSSELDSLRAGGVKEPVVFEIARQAMGVFVHPTNTVTSISGEQLRGIFTADGVPNPTWRVLGATGPVADQPIRIVSRSEESGTQRFLQDDIFGTNLRYEEIVQSNAEAVAAIESNPLAIGICGLRCGSSKARSLSLEVGGNIIPSDDLAILSGQYPLVRPLSIVMDMGNVENKATVEFLRYVLSQSGQAENVLAGYYPVDLPLIRAGMAKLHQSQANRR